MPNPDDALWIALWLFLAPVGMVGLLALWALRSWMRAANMGASLTIFEVIGMKLRRVDVDAVAEAVVVSAINDAEVHQIDLQRAYQAGVDLPAITQAWIAARQQSVALNFEEFVSMYRAGRLSEVMAANPQESATPSSDTASGEGD
jgi:uncharacterized protein YqfA (UPF0365 family)